MLDRIYLPFSRSCGGLGLGESVSHASLDNSGVDIDIRGKTYNID